MVEDQSEGLFFNSSQTGQASKQASVLHKNDMKKLKYEMRWKMNKQYEMELI